MMRKVYIKIGELAKMICPYCGNDDSDKFLHPEGNEDPYVICLNCNGEFEQEEIEYYQGQGDEKIWQMCSECEGEEGYFDDPKDPDTWHSCLECEGEGGWWVEKEEDKLISLSAITQSLENEIEWSKGNIHLAPTQDAADWFIKGLEQAKWLILEIAQLDSQDDLSTLEPKEDIPTGSPGYMGDYGGIPHGPFDL